MAESMRYDAAGNLVEKTDVHGRTTTYEYDKMGRLLARIPDPALAEPEVRLTYTKTVQRETMTDVSRCSAASRRRNLP